MCRIQNNSYTFDPFWWQPGFLCKPLAEICSKICHSGSFSLFFKCLESSKKNSIFLESIIHPQKNYFWISSLTIFFQMINERQMKTEKLVCETSSPSVISSAAEPPSHQTLRSSHRRQTQLKTLTFTRSVPLRSRYDEQNNRNNKRQRDK